MSQEDDLATYNRRQAERKRQAARAEEDAFADRQIAAEAIRLGLPSPRVREANAGPLVWKDGPRLTEMREVRTGHNVPSRQSNHVLAAGCWCGPREEPRAPDGERTWTHFALYPAERRLGSGDAERTQTAEQLADARARGER